MTTTSHEDNPFMTTDVATLDDRQLDHLARNLRPRMSRLALGDPPQVAADLLLLLGISAGAIEPALLATGRLSEPDARRDWAKRIARQLFDGIDTTPPPASGPAPLLDVNAFRGTPREYARAVNDYASGHARTLPTGIPKTWLREFAPQVLAEIERGTTYHHTGKLGDAGDREPGGLDAQ